MRKSKIVRFRSSLKYVITGFLLFAIMGCSDKRSTSSELDNSADKLFSVRKSDLIIGTLLTGAVSAKNKHKMALEASVKTTVTWIVDQNTEVKKGDLVVKFDDESVLLKIEDLESQIDATEKELLIEKENKLILESENKSKVRVATDSVVTAEENYSKYWKYDGKKAKDKMELEVASAERAYLKSKEEYLAKSDEINAKIYDDEGEKQEDVEKLAELKQDVEKKENAFNNSVLDRKIFKRYTYPNKLTELTNKLEQSKLNLKKVKVSTSSTLIQKNSKIKKIENQLRKHRKELERQKEYLSQMIIKAPVDGIVVYGNVDQRRNRTEIKVGMDVRRKQVLLTIPDMSDLIVDFELPEQFRHKVNEGADVIVSPESLPTIKLTGEVSQIAMVPVNQIFWDSSSPKVYQSKISFDEHNDQLVSGMSVQIQVTTGTLTDVVNIPVEAVFEEEGSYFAYVFDGKNAAKRIVELGNSNDNYVHIKSGLDVGEQVYLYRPFEQDSSE